MLAHELEGKKRELMDANATIKSIKDRLDRMYLYNLLNRSEQEREDLKNENGDIKKKIDSEKEGLVRNVLYFRKI